MIDALITFCAKYLIVAPIGGLLAFARREEWGVAKKISLELLLALPLVYLLCRMAGLLYQHEQPFAHFNLSRSCHTL